MSNVTAATISASRAFCRPVETPTVKLESSRAAMNCATNFALARCAHQKNATSAGTMTSRDQRMWGCSNRIVRTRVFSRQLPPDGMPQQHLQQQQPQPWRHQPVKQFLDMNVAFHFDLG